MTRHGLLRTRGGQPTRFNSEPWSPSSSPYVRRLPRQSDINSRSTVFFSVCMEVLPCSLDTRQRSGWRWTFSAEAEVARDTPAATVRTHGFSARAEVIRRRLSPIPMRSSPRVRRFPQPTPGVHAGGTAFSAGWRLPQLGILRRVVRGRLLRMRGGHPAIRRLRLLVADVFSAGAEVRLGFKSRSSFRLRLLRAGGGHPVFQALGMLDALSSPHARRLPHRRRTPRAAAGVFSARAEVARPVETRVLVW